jgi:carbamoyltransferase
LWSKSKSGGVFEELAAFSREDICAAAQHRLEEVLTRFVIRGLKETGHRHVVLAGGVFANVLVNQRLWALPEVDGLFVHPAMNDQGIAVGAALAWQAVRGSLTPTTLPHVYLGPETTEDDIAALLYEHKIAAERCDDIEARIVDLLVEGQVVARVDGRMEYGLRALGNRSILANPSKASTPSALNKRLGRSDFMPFAPAVLAEHVASCFSDYGPGVAETTRFMTLALRATDAFRALAPAVVHVDGTARPQVVHREHAPGFHRILSGFYERTGIPAVLNTSFNVHGEPIVCTASDALSVFDRKGVDALALGPFLVRRSS